MVQFLVMDYLELMLGAECRCQRDLKIGISQALSIGLKKHTTVCAVKTPRIVPRKARATRVLVNHFPFRFLFLTHPQFCVIFLVASVKKTH